MGAFASYFGSYGLIDDIDSAINELNININKNSLTEDNFVNEIYSAILKQINPTNRSKYDLIIEKLKKFSDNIATITQGKYNENENKTKSNLIFNKINEIITKIEELKIARNAAPKNKPGNKNNHYTAPPEANSGAPPIAPPETTSGANSGAHPETTSGANSGAHPETTSVANSGAHPETTSVANSGANSGAPQETLNSANNKAPPAANNASKSKTNTNAKTVDNIPADPDQIFKLIQEFESKFFNEFFTKVGKGKSSKNQAKNDTNPDHIFKFLKVLLLYKKLFPNAEKDYIDGLIRKYSNLCPKVGDTKCGLTKEKMIFGVKMNTYNNQSEKIKELGRNIEKKTSKNFSGMLDEIIPRSNANKKITNENMKKIESKIQYFITRASRIKYFSNENGDEILKKYLDFIKFLLLFKKIMKNKYKYKDYSSSIDRSIRQYLRECSFKEAINENVNERLKKCKSSKTQLNSGNWKYELINSDPEFIELLKDGWKNDEEFNKLRDEFNTMLDKYYDIFKVSEGERVKLLSANKSSNTSVGQSDKNNVNSKLEKIEQKQSEVSANIEQKKSEVSANTSVSEVSSGGSRKKSKKSRS
jgi:hypothetical protein